MKIELESQDIQLIAEKVAETLRPLLANKGNDRHDDAILDVQGICDYLKVSKRWVYERTRIREIPFFRISKQEIRFKKQDICDWLESRRELIFNDYSGNIKTFKRR